MNVLTSGASHFFGFHDLTPWNLQTNELVCLRTRIPEDRVPRHEDEAEVVVVDEETREVSVVGATHAWNWQKAARQRWLPALGKRVVAFNAANKSGFECRLIDLNAGNEQVLPLPLYDTCDHRGFGLTLNFRKLVRCQPGYGYDHPSPETNINYHDDGIFRVELGSGKVELILSISEFLDRNSFDPKLGEHYFTHIQISPDGRRFVFMHRCFLPSGGLVNSFAVADCNGSNVSVLLDDKMSHFDWKNNHTVIVWCRRNRAIKRLKESKWLGLGRSLYRLSRRININAVRQGVYNECFRNINVETGISTDIGRGVLAEDGHPQVNPVYADIWINDTYPDARGLLPLMLYSERLNKRVDVIRVPIQKSIMGTNWRCDLHPRWHPSGSRVCFDSSHLGRRQLCVCDVSEQVAALLQY